MQRRTAYILALVAIIALGTGWYFFNQGTQGQESTAIDRSALVRMHSPSEGRVDAPVVIVEFFDPACGTCREFYPSVKQLIAETPGRIRLVMR
jgi:protein-disulfide isomerase